MKARLPLLPAVLALSFACASLDPNAAWRGVPFEELVARAGKPTSVTLLTNGHRQARWIETGPPRKATAAMGDDTMIYPRCTFLVEVDIGGLIVSATVQDEGGACRRLPPAR